MAFGPFTLDFKIRVSNELDTQLKRSLNNTKKLNTNFGRLKNRVTGILPAIRRMNQAFGNIRFTLQNLQFLFAAIGGGAVFIKSIQESIKLKNSLIGLQSIARNLGKDVSKITIAAKELAKDGLIPLADVSRTLKNFLSSGLDIPKAIELFKSFRNAAAFNRQGQLDLASAIARASDGFKNRLSILVDNVGLTENLSQIEKRFQKETGKSTKAMTEQQRSFVLANGLIKNAGRFTGDYNRLLATFSGRLSEVGGRWKFFLAALGDTVTESKVAQKFLGDLAAILKTMEVLVKSNSKLLGDVFVSSLLVLANTVGILAVQFLNLFNVFKKIKDATLDFGTNKFKQDLVLAGREVERLENKIKQLRDIQSKKDVKSPGITKAIERFEISKDFELREQKRLSGLLEKSSTPFDQLSIGLNELNKTIKDLIEKTSLKGAGVKGKSLLTTGATAVDKVTPKQNLFEGFSLKGKAAKGVLSLLSGTGEQAALGALGQIPGFGPVLAFLARGPEEVRAFIKEFIESVPDIIQAIVESLPVVIEELAAAMPRIVNALAKRFSDPSFIARLAKAFGTAMIEGAKNFTEELVKGAPRFIEELIKKLGEAFGKIGTGGFLSGGSSGIGGALKSFTFASAIGGGVGGAASAAGSVFKSLGFAKGGQVKIPGLANGGVGEVPQGNPSDGFLARLQTGELTITRDTNRKLDDFLDAQAGTGGAEQVVKVETTLNERTLVDTIIRLQRNGQI